MRWRRIIIALSIVAALAVAAIFGLLQSFAGGRLRAGVESRLSAMLGQSVAIGHLGVELLPRIALAGGNVRVGEARAQAPALHVRSVRILPRVRSLWTADVIIERVELDGFVVSVLRDRKGRWHVPPAVPAPTDGGARGVIIEHVRIADGGVRVFDENEDGSVGETSSISDLQTDVNVEAGGLRLAPIAGRIGRARIAGEARTDAAATRVTLSAEAIADDDLPVFLRLLGTERPAFLRLGEPASASIAVHINRATSRFDGKGALRAPQVLLGTLRLQRFETPFVVQQTALEFRPTAFAMYGGAHDGIVTVDLASTPPTWATDSRVSSLAVGEFLRALTGRDQRLDGTAAITGTLRGGVGEPLERTVRGQIAIVVSNGVIRNFPLLATIDRALRVGEQSRSDTRFDRLSATMSVAAGQATTDDLVLQSGDVRVEAEGRIGADRSVALRGRAVVSAARVSRAVTSVHELARLKNARGEIELPLLISGSLDAPSINVDVAAALKQGLEDEIRRRLRRLIR
jgi:uncharacterized protein involved in outer membrane biogenesis